MKSLSRYLAVFMTGITLATTTASAVELTDELTDEDVDNLVKRSYQYVANVQREQ